MVLLISLILVVPLIFIILPTRIIGKKYLKQTKGKATIISCNHQSNFDPVVLKARVNPNCKIMAKDTLFKNKFLGWYLKKLGGYPVKRGENDIGVVKKTLTYLRQNNHLVIFPEGTRGKTGDLAELKNGLVMFALKSDCYVVPVVFKKKPKLFIFNTLLIGKPFKFSEIEGFKGMKIDKVLMDNASDILSEKMQFLKDINIKDYKKLLKADLRKSNQINENILLDNV